jgi:sigma-B regulation protein RsbU (phosphoserine phosphatase)
MSISIAAAGSGRNKPQMHLFDTSLPQLEPEVDLYALSRPAGTFTGDFYFTHRYADRLWLALGDVAGKGLEAAVVMAMIQEELEHRITSCARTRCDPAATTLRLHEFLRPLLPVNRFATAVIGHLRDDGTLVLANAGHCPPLVVRAGGTVEAIDSTGPAVGILPSARWRSVVTTLRRGDALLLYSDGLVEARSRDGQEFGVGGIQRAATRLVAGRPNVRARQISDAILDAVDRHAEGAREDDLTVVVVRRSD